MKIWLLIAFVVLLTACDPTNNTIMDDCLALEGGARDSCYFDQLQCSKMENEAFKDSCIAEIAKKTGDLNVCRLIKSDRANAYCRESIAIVKNDPTLCPNDDTYWHDNCFLHLAENNNESRYCAQIEFQTQRENCYFEIAKETNNPVLCPYTDEVRKFRCFYNIALSLQDIELCSEMNSTVSKDSCRIKVAKAANDVELCEEIHIGPIKQDCIKHFQN